MKKNDITYEYRVFTHRPIDVETLEVGRCTSKVIKELKSSDKVDGRFFHTSDTDEWFFCWNGNLQKLNLKGDADVNAALAEVKKLIADATAAVESIDGKADKGYVDDEIAKVNSTSTEAKATADAAATTANEAKYAVEELSKDVEKKADADTVKDLSALVAELPSKDDIVTTSVLNDYAKSSDLKDYAKLSDLEGVIKSKDLELYATKEFVGDEIKKIEIPTKVSELENNAGYLTKEVADSYYAAIGTTGSGDGVDKNYVDGELAKKQNIIDDIDDIRTKANKALQSIPDEYVTDSELSQKGYLTEHQDISHLATKAELPTVPTKVSELENDSKFITLSDVPEVAVPTKTSELTNDSGFITINDVPVLEIPEEYITEEELNQKGYLTEHQSLSDYYTKGEINDMIGSINDLIGEATALTNTILNA